MLVVLLASGIPSSSTPVMLVVTVFLIEIRPPGASPLSHILGI
jgi:hypothetical protein